MMRWLLALLMCWSLHAKPLVVVSFSILQDFVENLAGDLVDVEVIVPPNNDPHVFEPTPKTAELIQKANLVIINGLGFEGWITRLLDSSKTKAPVVVATEGLKPLTILDPALDSNKPVPDPHAWHKVLNAQLYCRNIAKALKELTKDNSVDSRLDAYLKELDSLHQWIIQQLEPFPAETRKVITAHDAFEYLGEAYKIKFMAPQGINTQSEPSAKHMAKLISQVKKEKVKAVFTENISNSHLISQLVEETGARINGTLYADGLSGKEGPAATYIAMMQHNVSQIIAAF